MAAAPFTWADTHRAPQRAGLQISHSSESAGWPWLFASLQSGKDYEASFPAVENHLLVMLITGRIFFSGCIGTLSVRRTLLAGSVSLTPGGFDLTSQVKSDRQTYQSLHLYVRRELLESIQEEMFGGGRVALEPLIGLADPLLRAVGTEIRDLLLAPHERTEAYVETLSHMLGSWLLRKYGSRQPSMKSFGRLSAQQFGAAAAYIEAHLDQNLSLASVAAMLGVSVTRLIAGFKASCGATPYQFIIRRRVDRAAALLRTSTLTMPDIALCCGFCDQQHMANVVQRLTGQTPGMIRRDH